MTSPPTPEWQTRYRWAAKLIAGGRVLDAGCGTGRGTELLAASASEAIGVDRVPAAVTDARRERRAEGIDFHEGDLHRLPFADDEFDHVVCFEALTQVAEPEQVLEELRRVLRDGGLLLASAPNRDSYPPGNPLQVSELSTAELKSMLEERFLKVAVHIQQSYHASLLADTKLLARDDPALPLDLTVLKAMGGPPGSELYAVAVASDGELPPAPTWLALGEAVDYNEQQSQLREWQERAVKAEAKALALSRELRERQR